MLSSPGLKGVREVSAVHKARRISVVTRAQSGAGDSNEMSGDRAGAANSTEPRRTLPATLGVRGVGHTVGWFCFCTHLCSCFKAKANAMMPTGVPLEGLISCLFAKSPFLRTCADLLGKHRERDDLIADLTPQGPLKACPIFG